MFVIRKIITGIVFTTCFLCGSFSIQNVAAAATAQETISSYGIDLNSITDDNCQREYEKCMNKTCFSKDFARCACSGSASMNIPLEAVEGLGGIIGPGLYFQQNNICKEILAKCPMKKSISINKYKMAADSDCSTLALAKSQNNLKTAIEDSHFNLLDQLNSCMKQYCGNPGSGQGGYSACFDSKNIDPLFANCQSVIDKADDQYSLKVDFMTEMRKYKATYCQRWDGASTDAAGNCEIEISFGLFRPNNMSQVQAEDNLQFDATGMKISATKKFRPGDVISCTEDGFGKKLDIPQDAENYRQVQITAAKIRMNATVISGLASVLDAGSMVNNFVEAKKAKKADANKSIGGVSYDKNGNELVAGKNEIIDKNKNGDLVRIKTDDKGNVKTNKNGDVMVAGGGVSGLVAEGKNINSMINVQGAGAEVFAQVSSGQATTGALVKTVLKNVQGVGAIINSYDSYKAQKANIKDMQNAVVVPDRVGVYCFMDGKPFLKEGDVIRLNWIE